MISAEFFTGITGSRIREAISQLKKELSQLEQANPVVPPSTLEVDPLVYARGNSVRTKAFLLFLANSAAEQEARDRRLDLLAADPRSGMSRLFQNTPSTDPANRVIASGHELKELRRSLDKKALTQEQRAEWAIPPEAETALPDVSAFLRIRLSWLRMRENEFIHPFGLRLSESHATPSWLSRDDAPDEDEE